MHRWLIAWIMLGLGVTEGVYAQTSQSVRFESAGGAAGLGFLKPDHWGLVRSRVRNDTDLAAQPLSAVQFKEGDNIQFVVSAWLPAQSVREVLHPVYLHSDPRSDRAVEMMTLLIETGRGEVIRGKEDGLMRLEATDANAGFVSDADADDAISAAIAGRLSINLGKRMAYVSAKELPMLTAAYGGIDTLVLAHRELALTPAQAAALRGWIAAGGRLWLMLDRLPDNAGPSLLGNDWPATVVDRLPITQLQLTSTRGGETLVRERDEPWDILRVVARNVRVLHEVKGWPASFTFDVGRGRVIVTTLDAAAWWTTGAGKDGPEPKATEPLTDLASTVFGSPPALPIATDRFGAFVREQIGYRILGRGPVLAVLVLLPVAVVVSGVWLARRRRLELVGVVAASAAVGLCAVLIGMGAAQRRTVPLTVASAQWVEVAPGQDLANVSAAISIYSPEADRGPLRGERGGVLWPDMTGQGGRQLRMVWSDIERWSWEGLELPSGAVRTAEATSVIPMQEHANVSLRFGPRGMEGQIVRGPFEGLEDLVLATPVAALAVRAGEDGAFVVQPDDALSGGDYIAGVTLSQAQRARQEVYRALLGRSDYPTRPTLLAWARSLDLGLELSIPATQHHSALVALPVAVRAATAGERVTVPGAFVPFTLVRGPNNVGTTTLFNAATREWIGDVTQGATLIFRFELPQSVLPLRPESGTLTLDMTAADRQVEVLKFEGSRLQTVRTLDRPAGMQRVRLDAAGLGQIDRDGGLLVGLRVAEAADFTGSTTWRIDHVHLDVEGVVSP